MCAFEWFDVSKKDTCELLRFSIDNLMSCFTNRHNLDETAFNT